MRHCLVLCVCLLSGFFSGCAGYRLGPTNGVAAGAMSIQINSFQNQTSEPRLIEPVITALRRNLQQDGTFRLATKGEGDVVVSGVLLHYYREGLSFEPRDVVTVRDFRATLTAKVTAIQRSTGKTLVEREVIGRTTIRMGADLGSAERQAVPSLAEDLAKNVTALLVDGSW
jgi:hypothetical protein